MQAAQLLRGFQLFHLGAQPLNLFAERTLGHKSSLRIGISRGIVGRIFVCAGIVIEKWIVVRSEEIGERKMPVVSASAFVTASAFGRAEIPRSAVVTARRHRRGAKEPGST